MSEVLGTLVADERIFQIRRVSLERGEVRIHAFREIERDEAASRIREYQVFGADGSLVYRSDRQQRGSIATPAVEPGDTVSITACVGVMGKQSSPE